MYDIYIKNYYSPEDGTLVTDEETRLYSIPISQEDREYVLMEPSVSAELGKTGTFEFSVYPTHPYYHSFAQLRTIMRVVYDGDTIFRGRVLTIDNTFTGTKKIHCEGDMAFLLDSFQEGVKEERRSIISVQNYIEKVLNAHNQQMGESGEDDKKIYPGWIPGAYGSDVSEEQKLPNDERLFGSNSYEQSLNALETLTNEYGGFFRTRYDETEKKCYLDWFRLWFRDDTENGQPIAITQNMIDANSNSEVENIFTALIPIGSSEGEDIFIDGYATEVHGNNKRILVPQILDVFSEEELSTGYMTADVYDNAVRQYGIIYKTQNFSNADTKEKLFEYACEWIKNNYVGGITGYDLTAVDMHHVNNVVAKYLVGDRVGLKLPSDITGHDEYVSSESEDRIITIARTLLSVKYNLHNPEKNGYNAGIPSDILNREYGTKSTSKSSSSGGGGGKGAGAKAGGGRNNNKDQQKQEEERQKNLESIAWKFVINEKYNNDEYKVLLDKSESTAGDAMKAAAVYVKQVLDDPEIGEQELTTLVLDGRKAAVAAMDPAIVNKFKSNPELVKKIVDNPGFLKMMSDIDEYNNVVNSLVINAGAKAIELRGDSSMSADTVIEAMANMDITGNETVDELIQKGKDAINNSGAQPANTTFYVKSKPDIQGHESGELGLSKEGLANVNLDAGGNEGTGVASIGKDILSGKWLISMNQPLQWKDSGGTVHTLPNGTVNAKDVSSIEAASGNPIPSFNTKFAAIDEAMIGILHVGDLDAINANIENLTSRIANIDQLIARTVDSKLTTAERISADYIQAKVSIGVGSSPYQARWMNRRFMLSNGNTETIYFLGRAAE